MTAADCYDLAASGCSDAEIIAYAAMQSDRPWLAIRQCKAWLAMVRADQVRRAL